MHIIIRALNRKRVPAFCLFMLMIFGCKTLPEGGRAGKSDNTTVLRLGKGPGNPRNSEGDFVTLKNGRILFIYSHFTGTSGGDYGNAYLASRYSTDKGKTWSKEDQLVVRQEGDMNVMSVSLLRLQNGDIALFYVRKNSKTDCMPMMRISKDEGQTWSDARRCITDEEGYYTVNNNRVIQLKNGRLLMPLGLYDLSPGSVLHKGGIWAYYSDDNGGTWHSSKEVPNPDKVVTQEPGAVELKNGNILMFIRTNSGTQYLSYSNDGGETWSPAHRSDIASPLSPATIARIPATGDLLMVWNNNGVNQKRTPLNIAVSKDDGKTWDHMKTLEDDPGGTFCYTAVHFTDKAVLLSYSNWANMGSVIKRVSLKWIYK